MFTFSVGQHNYDVTPLQWIACANKGETCTHLEKTLVEIFPVKMRLFPKKKKNCPYIDAISSIYMLMHVELHVEITCDITLRVSPSRQDTILRSAPSVL